MAHHHVFRLQVILIFFTSKLQPSSYTLSPPKRVSHLLRLERRHGATAVVPFFFIPNTAVNPCRTSELLVRLRIPVHSPTVHPDVLEVGALTPSSSMVHVLFPFPAHSGPSVGMGCQLMARDGVEGTAPRSLSSPTTRGPEDGLDVTGEDPWRGQP